MAATLGRTDVSDDYLAERAGTDFLGKFKSKRSAKWCLEGTAISCNSLGGLYDKAAGGGSGYLLKKGADTSGAGVLASLWYSRACNPYEDPGDITGVSSFHKRYIGDACIGLGNLLLDGAVVPQDQALAVRAYAQGCAYESPRACAYAGVLHKTGKGVPKDDVKAAEYYTLACEGEDAWACENLAFQYIGGDGVEADSAQALQLGQKACELDPYYCRRLAYAYWLGDAVAVDKGRAAELFQRACDEGNSISCEALTRLTESP